MSSQEPPKIEFPCAYPIKVLGRQHDAFEPEILAIFEAHAPGFDRETIAMKSSRGGTFVSLTITIEATGTAQLSTLHEALMATGFVSMVI
jgi:putative lipoic acid-binding regulatory protein